MASLTVHDNSDNILESRQKERVVKLRNPWPGSREEGWFGKASIDDHNFWDSAEHDQ